MKGALSEIRFTCSKCETRTKLGIPSEKVSGLNLICPICGEKIKVYSYEGTRHNCKTCKKDKLHAEMVKVIQPYGPFEYHCKTCAIEKGLILQLHHIAILVLDVLNKSTNIPPPQVIMNLIAIIKMYGQILAQIDSKQKIEDIIDLAPIYEIKEVQKILKELSKDA